MATRVYQEGFSEHLPTPSDKGLPQYEYVKFVLCVLSIYIKWHLINFWVKDLLYNINNVKKNVVHATEFCIRDLDEFITKCDKLLSKTFSRQFEKLNFFIFYLCSVIHLTYVKR